MRCEIGWPIVTFVPGQQRHLLPQLLEHGLARPVLHREPHVDLGRLDALHVLVELGAAGPARRRRHLGHAEQQPLERIAQRIGVREARAWNRSPR